MITIKAALTGVLAFTAATSAALAEPKTNLLSQWSEGSDAAAIAKLGEMFTAAGGKWEQTSIAGHTANTLAKLQADVVAGNAPPAVQLKGPEIAEWNETGKTANLDAMASEEGWDKVVAPDLLEAVGDAKVGEARGRKRLGEILHLCDLAFRVVGSVVRLRNVTCYALLTRGLEVMCRATPSRPLGSTRSRRRSSATRSSRPRTR